MPDLDLIAEKPPGGRNEYRSQQSEYNTTGSGCFIFSGMTLGTVFPDVLLKLFLLYPVYIRRKYSHTTRESSQASEQQLGRMR